MEGTMVNVPGGRVWTGTTGDVDAPPLLVLHGGPGFPHNYLLPLQELGTVRPVVFYDQLGCGLSERPQNESLWTLKRSLEEVDAVRNALELQDFHLLGHSWGGLLALEYSLTKPEGLQSLILSSPLVDVARWEQDAVELLDALPEPDRQTIASHEKDGYYDCLEYAAAALTFWKRHVCRTHPWPHELEDAMAGEGTEVYRTMWGPSEFTQTGNLADIKLSSRLHMISVPSLWSCGRYDEARPDSTKSFTNMTPNSQFRIFEDSSHMPHLEEPNAYLDLVRDFLQDIDNATA